ncbi:DNA polymerase alpha/epsilon subunit B-domain-containing protein [Dichomitus squalens]|uniref:DNA-directed DNA polymerase n=1 Tax=Dichomitus squalens TaxID=114155 RepID=A0A4Q9N0V3_9APHY|nr:DNA polymerase alpha/epsilon subunit B-domain-containing protein [Dichomitus squalens]
MAVIDPIPTPSVPLTRPSTTVVTPPDSASFLIGSNDKSYRHQYSNIYFVRLRALRQHVEQQAQRKWSGVAGNPVFVPRVLDVEKGKLCFVIGTVYMEMPLKPNVLEDIARDRSIPAPPPREKYYSDSDSVTLEDESGRICLVGSRVTSTCLVTGVILGALGIETHTGDFEVVDLCYPGMAPQPTAGLEWPSWKVSDEIMDVDGTAPQVSDECIALVSGLEIGSLDAADGQLQLLAEYLTGEAGGLGEQSQSSCISRLIIAGNSFAPIDTSKGESERRSRKYGQEVPFSPHPTQALSAYLTDICRSLSVHLLPGPLDPAATILPQQPIPRAMFGGASHYANFSSESNPTYINVSPSREPPSTSRTSQPGASSSKANGHAEKVDAVRSILVHSGQPLDDMFKYVPTPPITRMALAEATLRWRHIAPTAPDTLWCHPYFAKDPFVIPETPDIYVVGNQPAFATKLVSDDGSADGEEGSPKRCRIVLVPNFRQSGVLVLVNMRTLDVRRVQFAMQGMSAGGGET